MSRTIEQSYGVVITLRVPGAEPVEVTLSLAPPDLVPLGDGRAKPLGECTLAELSAFADELETQLWEQYAAHNLEGLAEQADTRVKITIVEKARPEETPNLDTILSQILLFPPPAPATPAESAPLEVVEPRDEQTADEAQKPAPEDEAPEPAAAAPSATTAEEPDAEVDGPTAEPPVEEIPRGEIPAPAVTEPDEAPAREAPEGPTEEAPEVPVAPPELRIAGRRRPLGHQTWAAVDILVNEPPLRGMQRHALSSMDREVAGMLIGPRPEQKKDGRWIVHVTDRVEAKHTQMRGASVTYTPESWRYVHDVLAERYPNEEAVIVGWYHTHPGFGIFLSSMDMFIHTHFFNQPWHIAYVLDPRARSSGFFCWDRQQKKVQAYDFPRPGWAPNSW